jgi:hypothetical protein
VRDVCVWRKKNVCFVQETDSDIALVASCVWSVRVSVMKDGKRRKHMHRHTEGTRL